jgi:hypothetical protein
MVNLALLAYNIYINFHVFDPPLIFVINCFASLVGDAFYVSTIPSIVTAIRQMSFGEVWRQNKLFIFLGIVTGLIALYNIHSLYASGKRMARHVDTVLNGLERF